MPVNAGLIFAFPSPPSDTKIDALTELSITFEGVFERDRIVAALVASDHNSSAAALHLLESQEDEERSDSQQQVLPQSSKQLHQISAGSGRSGLGAKNKQKKKMQGRRRNGTHHQPHQLGSTCVDTNWFGKAAGGGDAAGGDVQEEVGRLEEEEGDDGASSKEYRARADAVAQEMKTWFQRAAHAFVQGGAR